MQIITVTGTVRPPEEVEYLLSELTTIEAVMQRYREVNAKRCRLRRELEELQSEVDELDDEAETWLPARLQQLTEQDPAEADKWTLRQAMMNPSQQKFGFLKG